MREGLRPLLLAVSAVVLAAVAAGQSRVNYYNGVGYVWPTAHGDATDVLTTDGSETLFWSEPTSPSGVWADGIVLSTVACPAGWTRLAAAEDRVLRGDETASGTGGGNNHGHSLVGVAGGSAPALTGASSAGGMTVSGSVGLAGADHTHGTTLTTAGASAGGLEAVSGVTVISAGPSATYHSHDAGSFVGSDHTHSAGLLALVSHGHAPGTLNAESSSTLPAYITLILCEKD